MWKEFTLFLAAIVIILAAFVFGESTLSPTFQQCIQTNQNNSQSAPAKDNPAGLGVTAYAQCTGEFVEEHDGGISALAAIIIAAFTGTLWIATSRQARLTKEALIVDKRAFVFAAGLRSYFEPDAVTGQHNWRMSPVWQNSGETPTRRLQLYCDCFLSNAIMPANFDFTAVDPMVPPGAGMLGPNTASPAGQAPHIGRPALTPQDILDVQNGRKYLYLWGWARYFDAFPKTPARITRFCWMIIISGNPITFDPNVDPNSLTFFHLYQARGNCADDECRLQGIG